MNNCCLKTELYFLERNIYPDFDREKQKAIEAVLFNKDLLSIVIKFTGNLPNQYARTCKTINSIIERFHVQTITEIYQRKEFFKDGAVLKDFLEKNRDNFLNGKKTTDTNKIKEIIDFLREQTKVITSEDQKFGEKSIRQAYFGKNYNFIQSLLCRSAYINYYKSIRNAEKVWEEFMNL